MKPYVFVGSSSEGESVAYAIQENLERAAEVAVWNQNLFQPGEYALESLLRQLDRADVGILVFTPDDMLRIRGVEQLAVRDNVIFEFGLFIGKLGRAWSFAVAPRNETTRLPTDLLGVNLLHYEPERGDGNLRAALGPACNRIRSSLADVVPSGNARSGEGSLSIFERRDRLSGNQRRLLAVLEGNLYPTWNELRNSLSCTIAAELHYRLEHLRLMGFLVRRSAKPNELGYQLSVAYRAVAAERHVDWDSTDHVAPITERTVVPPWDARRPRNQQH